MVSVIIVDDKGSFLQAKMVQTDVTQLLLEAASLMLIGMLVVFVFLMVLILSTKLLSHLSLRFFPTPQSPAVAAVKTTENPDAATVAAVSVAVHRYRSRKQ